MKHCVNNWLLAVLAALPCFFAAPLHAGDKAPLPIFMAGTPPGRDYELLTPISAEKDDVQKVIEKLRSIGRKEKADAVIDIKCSKTIREQSFTGLYSPSYCEGLAVRWK